MRETRLAGSFRDPAGHVFSRDGDVFRRVTPAGLPSYRRLMDSGAYAALTGSGVLVPHEEIGGDPDHLDHLILRPRQLPMVSYPYEWSLSQLRDAALVTLKAQRLALRHRMTLKDASAFNVQFLDGRPVLIDTLSFEPIEGTAWVAYRQFCQHFLAPLAIGAMRDPQLLRMEGLFLDGVPLSLASRLLPRRSYVRAGLLLHIHMHAAAEGRLGRAKKNTEYRIRNTEGQRTRSLEALVDSLERAVRSVTWKSRSAWAEYYGDAESYSREAFAAKAEIVRRWLVAQRPATVWDLGANTGHFSRMAAGAGATVVAFDSDPACVDRMYVELQKTPQPGILPLVLDLANPSAAIGWANRERLSLTERGPADLLLALAVTHHLAIGNNVPLPSIAEYFARLANQAIVEFIPKSDPMVQRMLRSRADVFSSYDRESFEAAILGFFTIDERAQVTGSDRHLYLLTRR